MKNLILVLFVSFSFNLSAQSEHGDNPICNDLNDIESIYIGRSELGKLDLVRIGDCFRLIRDGQHYKKAPQVEKVFLAFSSFSDDKKAFIVTEMKLTVEEEIEIKGHMLIRIF